MRRFTAILLSVAFLVALAGGAYASHDNGNGKSQDDGVERAYVCHYDADADAYELLFVPNHSAHFDADKHPDDFAAFAWTDGTFACEEEVIEEPPVAEVASANNGCPAHNGESRIGSCGNGNRPPA